MGRLFTCICVLLLCVFSVTACGTGDRESIDRSPKATFMHQGVILDFSETSKVVWASIADENNRTVFYQKYGQIERKRLRIPLAWETDTAYAIRVGLGRRTVTVNTRTPEEESPGAAVHFGLPYAGREQPFSLEGLRRHSESYYSAAYGSTVTGGLTLRHYGPVPAEYRMEIELPQDLEIVEVPEEMQVGENDNGHLIGARTRLAAPSQLAYFVFRVKLKTQNPVACKARVVRRDASGEVRFDRTVHLSSMPLEEIREKVKIESIRMPTSAKGLFDTKSRPDTLYFGPRFFRMLANVVGTASPPRNSWTPYTHQTVQLRNTGDAPLAVLATSRITSRNTDRVPPEFLPPDRFTGKLKDMSVAVAATLPPQTATTIIVPVFVNSTPHPGVYDRRLHIYPMGNSLAIHREVRPLYVTRTDMTAVGVTLGSLVLSLGGLVFFVLKFRGLIAGMPVRHLVVISFFGAVTFAGINVPLRIFNSVITALFGPFSVLVIGLFNDLVYFSMIVALLRLAPRPGVVTLAFLVRYLLAGMMLGGFHLLDFLFMGTSLVLKEAALYASGITRKQDEFEWTFVNTLAAALLLGAADAMINASSVYLHVVFYRLYFADWYIVLSILFNGFVYTGIGVFFGKRFSNTLKMVQE